MRKQILAAIVTVLFVLATPVFGGTEKWTEARSPNFIVVSNAGEKEARRTAVQFEQIRAVFRESLPYAARSSRVITILAVKDEESLRELLPDFWAEPGRAHPAGVFLRQLDQFQVAVNLSAGGANPFQGIYHEYYHALTIPYFPTIPVWVAEGLAEFYGNTDVSDRGVKVGMASFNLIATLKSQPLIPLDMLLKVDRESPYYNEQSQVSIFYAESWALAHYLMLGDGGIHRPMLSAYLGARGDGAGEDQAATAFGDLGKLQNALENYVHGASFPYMKVPVPAKIDGSDFHIRQLSDAEGMAYRGGFLAFHGQFKSAEALLREAVRLDPQLALAQQNLGILEYLERQRTEAFQSFSTALTLDPRNALARYLRAELVLSSADSSSDAARHEAEAGDDLRQAIAISPDFAPPYGLLAIYLAANGENLPEALELARRGVALEPGSAQLQFAVAQVLTRRHRYDEAQAETERIRDRAADAAGRATAERFLDFIERSRDLYNRGLPQQGIAPAAADDGENEPGAEIGTTPDAK